MSDLVLLYSSSRSIHSPIMDASKITELRQKQLTNYTSRNKPMDSSTLTWMQQMRSSRNQCTPQPIVPTPSQQATGCKKTTLSTGSTVLYPNAMASATGSASRVYTSQLLTMQQAGQQSCEPFSSTANTPYAIAPRCEETCLQTNGPTAANPNPIINHQGNPYLPPFDTFRRLKNREARIILPVPDANQRHSIEPCCNSTQ